MRYLITFLEGIIAFISPCNLPMIPIFISYFAGGGTDRDMKRTVKCAFGFVAGFSVIFILLGALSGLLGGLLIRFSTVLNIVAGAVVVIFGLNYIGVLKINFLHKATSAGGTAKVSGFFSAVVFGIVFSISWTPCVGMFLGSALALASQQASAVRGLLLLVCFSLGLGLPLLLSAILVERLKTTFDWIKKHYKVVNLVSGIFLVVMGVLMMTGTLHRFFDMLL